MLNLNTENGQAKNEMQTEKKKVDVLNIVGIVICVLLIPILVINCLLIIQSMIHKDEVPGLGKFVPLIVTTKSMEPEIRAGDMIICEKVDPNELNVNDVISYFDPKSSGSSVVTHRIDRKWTEDTNGDGVEELFFHTVGDNNDLGDNWDVPAENVIGRWIDGARIGLIGHVILFMQSTWGLVICVMLPIAALIAVEVIRRKKHDGQKQNDIDVLKAELEALKAAQAQKAETAETPARPEESDASDPQNDA